MSYTAQQAELIARSKQANLVAYCESKGIGLKKVGREYFMREHDSLCISAERPNEWYRHSSNDTGDPIDFCTKILGYTFWTAVKELTGEYPSVDTLPPREAPCKPDTAPSQKRVIAYLCKTRKLAYGLVTALIRCGKLWQDTRGNCVFPITDFDDNVLCYELKGTSPQHKFQIVTGEQEGFGFRYHIGYGYGSVLYFEAVVDLLSYVQLHPMSKDILLVSMSGLKCSIVQNFQKHYPDAAHFACVDNDAAGDDFVQETGLDRITPSSDCKDWNEQLMKYNQ